MTLTTLNWERITLPELQPRAYHTSSFVVLNGIPSVFIIGGITFVHGHPQKRLPLSEIAMVKYYGTHCTLETVSLSLPREVFLSYHSAAVTDSRDIVIFGGYQCDSSDVNSTDVRPSSGLIFIDLTSMTATLSSSDSAYDFGTAGHSFLKLKDSSYLIAGGTCKAYNLYTYKALVPSPCELEICNIINSPEVSPISWLKCEGKCKKWIHQFCANVGTVPKGKWICKSCKKPKHVK